MAFVPGAIAATYVSTDARTFEEPPADWQPTENWTDKRTWFAGSPQTLSGDLIREGATGVAGQVAEPYLAATVRPQILFPAYLSGFNLAESFYLSIPALSWQTVVIGDPLCRPFKPEVMLTRADLDAPIDQATTLPKFFSARGSDMIRVDFGLTDPAQIALAVRSQAERQRGNRAATQKLLTELTDANPAIPAAQLQLAEMLDAQGDYDGAIQRYRLILKQQPKNGVALNNLAYLVAVQKHNPQEAKPLADQALRLLPREATVLDTAGWVQYLLGDYDGASKLLARAVEGGAGNPDIHLHAAFVYAAAGAKAASLAELDAAVKLDPKLANRDDVKELRKKLEGS
jgi:tetratricopeptide (TPR) repeat protein